MTLPLSLYSNSRASRVLPGLKQLQSLHLGWCFSLTDSDLQHVSNLTRLSSLGISYTKVCAWDHV